MEVLEIEFEFCSRQLAYMKLYSLMRHLVNDSKYRNHTPAQKLTRLEEIVGTGKISFLKGTGLRGDVLDMVREIFRSDKENIRNLMCFESVHANKVLLANIVNCGNKTDGVVPEFNKNLNLNMEMKSLNELLELNGMEDKAIYKRVVSGNSLESDYGLLNELLITKLKNSLKFIRNDIADKFVHMSHIEELRGLIANENLIQKTTHERKPDNFYANRCVDRSPIIRLQHSLQNVSSNSRSAPLDPQVNANDNYANLKASLSNLDHSNTFEQKVAQAKEYQKAVDKIRQDAVKEKLDFILVKTYQNERGDTVYLWEDRAFRGRHKEYGVTYIEDRVTKKIAVKYGAKSCAKVIFDADIQNGISPLLLEVGKGTHITFGDANNKNLSIELSGLHRDIALRQKQITHVDSYRQRQLSSGERAIA